MSRINILTAQNFVFIGNKNKSLGINVDGNVLVYFKINGDPNCNVFDPVFSQLAAKENRAMLAILDIQQNSNVYRMSKETSTPLQAVPLLILYVNGRPHAKFNGTKNLGSLQGFITKALSATAAAPKTVPSTFMPSQNMYGGGQGSQYQQPQKGWNPEIGKPPSLKGVIKGGGGYMNGNNVEEEDEHKLMIPDTVIPHNTPWEIDFSEPN
ncbi:MAG TPA: thioredoxin family protein [Saprospiraceae bacterium]|nr:thioredoxin family protein [Saprospiraceae bacterium]